jgi:Protein of unknown function (DUF2442)
MATTREQFKAANARGVAAIARGPVARSARYDSRRRLIVITLEGGCELAFPAALAEGLADAPRSKLAKIKISPNGLGLYWPLLDADLYVPGLIEGAFGSHRWMQQIVRLGAQVAVQPRRRHPERMASAAVVPGKVRRHKGRD